MYSKGRRVGSGRTLVWCQAAGKAGRHEYLAVTAKRRRVASALRCTGVQTAGKAGRHEYLAVTAKRRMVPSALAPGLAYSIVSHPVALDGQGIGERRFQLGLGGQSLTINKAGYNGRSS